ncbi:MAG TPA: ATP-dependent DNA helicase RecG [Thermodesulfobacteriota bacterium]|nr:ATP-dependent DNA helicase RecG [Thermodesulfobacteriota bacterium]
MSQDLSDILKALEKPLKFASKNSFSKLNTVKSLDSLVGDLALKALSLDLTNAEAEIIRDIKESFLDYEGLETEGKKKAIRKALGDLERLGELRSAGRISAGVEKPQKQPEVSRNESPEAPEEERGDPFSTPVQFIKGVGPRIAALLEKRGIKTVGDALYYFPRRYEDRRIIKKISRVEPGRRETVMGEILAAGRVRTRRRAIYQAVISDGSGTLTLVWFQFNEGYLRNAYKKGARVILTGDVTVGYGGELQIIHPRPEDIEVIDEGEEIGEDNVHFGRIVPVYPLTEGIKQRRMRGIMKSVVDGYAHAVSLPVPLEISAGRGIADFGDALSRVHFPEGDDRVIDLSRAEEVYGSPPHRTLAYSEFFLMELGLALKKRDVAESEGIVFHPTGGLRERLLSSLAFGLTSAQKRVLSEIEADMISPRPMNRLLQGDVGSGKTIVAIMSMLAAVESGYQAVLMAPTEILAEQHLSSVLNSMKGMGVRVVFLKSGMGKREKNAYYKALASGEAQIAVGTHALLQEKVDFRNLGLVVIDEQHRFGVLQRASLMGKGVNPDVLVMTATPIPRTLALTVYGDLEVSVLDEMPPGRKAVRTRVFYDQKGSREKAYDIVRKEIEKGRQAYVVYPMIEESENPDFKDIKYATRMAEELGNEIFPDFTVGLLHGRMKPEEKDAVMRRFIAGHVNILVSTTVIEVGVDVPNATVMVIENAERFGLTQLHQLRGRIGRGGHDSHCILISGFKRSGDADKRLSIMAETSDGFRIAEADLMIRGPGDFLGTKQSGLPQFRFADILRDWKILEEAREDAFRLVSEDPALSKYPELREEVTRRYGSIFELPAIS